MFSILVSELTPELLAKAEYWAILSPTTPQGIPFWKDVRRAKDLIRDDDEMLKTVYGEEPYAQSMRCFPVTLSPDGTEVRLECPRMPDEVDIDGPIGDDFDVIKGMDASGIYNGRWDWYWPRKGTAFCLHSLRPPTPEHYPRRTCDGVWVWSTRR